MKATQPAAAAQSPTSGQAVVAVPLAAEEPTEAEVAEVARAEAEQAAALEELQERARAAVQAAEARVAALPALDAEPEGTGERLAVEKRAERLVKRNASVQAQLAERDAQLAKTAAYISERDVQTAAQISERDARIVTLEARVAKAEVDEEEQQMCCVCLAAPKTHVLAQCGHLCACAGCVEDIKAKDGLCPICRSLAVLYVHVYYA